MKGKAKKIFAAVLALVLVFGTCGISAYSATWTFYFGSGQTQESGSEESCFTEEVQEETVIGEDAAVTPLSEGDGSGDGDTGTGGESGENNEGAAGEGTGDGGDNSGNTEGSGDGEGNPSEDESEGNSGNEDYVYVTMNIPYSDFFDAVAPEAQQAETYYGADVDVDTWTYATSKYGVDGTGKRSTSGTAKGTYNNGKAVRGVYYAVKMDKDDYDVLKEAYGNLTEGDDYYFTDLDQTDQDQNDQDQVPVSYLTLSLVYSSDESDTENESEETGSYSFSFTAEGLKDAKTEDADIEELSYTETYGDYMFELLNVKNQTMSIDNEVVTIAAEYLTFSDNSEIALYNVDNIWMGTRYNHQIAWSVEGGNGYRLLHNKEGNPECYQYTMTDYNLKSVTVITDLGVYTFTCDISLLPYYSGDDEITVSASDGDTSVKVSVPSAFENVKVSVYYSVPTASGRGSTAQYVAEEVGPVNGSVALTEAIDCETNGTYTILVESDNYAPIKVVLDVPMTKNQRSTLESLVEEGNEVLARLEKAGESHETLKKHVEEAEELLSNEDAMYSEASELIEELTEYILEARLLLNEDGGSVYIECISSIGTGASAVIDTETLLTEEDKQLIAAGYDIGFVVSFNAADEESVTDDELAAVYEAAQSLGDDGYLYFLDISLEKYTALGNYEVSREDVTEAASDIVITISVPENMQEYIETEFKGRSGSYYVIRVHDGEADILDAVYDSNEKTLTFETDRFSLYALAYAAGDAAENTAAGSGETGKASSLEEAISIAGTLNESDYSAESWATLQQALENAIEVLNDENSSPEDIERALATLNAAIDALEETEDGDSSESSGSEAVSGGTDDSESSASGSGSSGVQTGDPVSLAGLAAMCVSSLGLGGLTLNKCRKKTDK